MGSQLQHVVISASAGSGKTYQLVRRYVLLLAWGVEPERIAAMTFTKKASGEFFNRILNCLASLAAGELKADTFFADMSPLPAQWPDFRKLLRMTTESMQRLRLGTLDSFFANVTACFPLELGLSFGASVMAEDETQTIRAEVLSGQMERMFRTRDEAGMRTLLEGFKQATYGAEEKRSVEALMGWIDDGHELWLERPDVQRWGGAAVIWPRGQGARVEQLDMAEAIAKVRDSIDFENKLSTKGAEKWDYILRAAESMVPGQEIPREVAELLEKCGAVWQDLTRGEAEMTWFKKVVFSGAEAAAIVELCRCIVARELLVRCRRTAGVAQMIQGYEKDYAASVRAAGKLTFADVTRLVGQAADAWWMQGEGAGLWYRLDGRYDHWLFDEFQDTSFQQWSIVGGLVDEVLQATGQGRSFFAVGDPKQSIYLWRQAEPKLFRELAQRADEHGRPLMQLEELLVSWRSSAAVLEAVNRVCVSDDTLTELLPGATQFWSCGKHLAAKNLPGCARLLWAVQQDHEESLPTPDDLVVELLREMNPLQHGLSCAVLVRQNDRGRVLTERIRRDTGMEVVCESIQQPAIDNPVTLAVLSLFKLAAHPADGAALEHLRMSPLWPWIETAESKRYATCREVLRRVMTEGFAPLVHEWLGYAQAAAGTGWDAFSALRGRQLGDMAAEFDETGSRDVDAFLDFAQKHTLRVRGGQQAIQVMTIHAAKGLEFDMVILPELGANAMSLVRPRSLLEQRDEQGVLQWVLQEPPRKIADLDEVLSHKRQVMAERQEFESLCRLYVAMTRAKHGLYLVSKPPTRSEGVMSEARLLRERLGAGKDEQMLGGVKVNIAWSHGDPLWYAAYPPVTRQIHAAASESGLGELLRRCQPIARRVTPSGEEDFRMKGATLFSAGRDHGRELGTLVHEMLSTLEWSLDLDWTAFDQHPAFVEAQQMIEGALRTPAIAALFDCPASSPLQLWRELPFDVMLDSHGWVSGTFDRVVIEPAHDRATIIDYKTDHLGENEVRLAERIRGYAPQLSLYRAAVQCLTGVSSIQCKLVFLRTGRVVDV
jgi:ATP-dependent helicase/nuclease subunit A